MGQDKIKIVLVKNYRRWMMRQTIDGGEFTVAAHGGVTAEGQVEPATMLGTIAVPGMPAPRPGPPSEGYTGTSRSSPPPKQDCCRSHPGHGLSPGWRRTEKSSLGGK